MHPLSERITALQRRLAMRERATAACRIAAAMIAAAMLLGALDYYFRYADPGLRLMATAALVAVGLWAAHRWWYLPRRPANALAVARRIEARFPQLRDALASAVEFLEQREEDHTAGSPELRRLVVAQAQVAIDDLPLDEVIDRRPLRQAAISLAIAVGVAALLLAWDARAVGTALARLVSPLGTTQWPRQHHLVFRNPPQRLAAGQTFEVELVDNQGRLPEEVRIEYRMGQGSTYQRITEPMKRSGDAMIARRENVRQSFAYRAFGGDDNTMPWRMVEVVEPPRLESFAITVHPPAYTALPPIPVQPHLEVLEGTGIEVSGTASEPLRAARILLEGLPPLEAVITTDAADQEARAFHIAPEQWIAKKSSRYRLELTNSHGVSAVVGQWSLQTRPDSPPTIAWQKPSDNLYLTSSAVVPIELIVNDDLAIQRVELVGERTDPPQAERESQPTELRFELYRGPERPFHSQTETAPHNGEKRQVQFSWPLEPLALPSGAELLMAAEAADYRPNVGRTASRRRITIITADELQSRFADHQAQIVRQLERALAIQRATRAETRQLENHRQHAALREDDRHVLRSAVLNQRRVARLLADKAEGVPALAEALLAEMAMNRISGSDLTQWVEQLTTDLNRLSSGPLEAASRELSAAQEAAENVTSPDREDRKQALWNSLSTASTAQENVIATVEQWIQRLAGKADFYRLVRQLSELRQDQLAHEKSVRAELGTTTLPLRPDELTRAQRDTLNRLVAGQQSIAARFQHTEQAMDQLAQELATSQDKQADLLLQAVELMRRLAIEVKMQETVLDLSENRIGRVLARQAQLASDLQQVLDVLLEQNTTDEQVVGTLRETEKRLGELREQLSTFRKQVSDTEHRGDRAENLTLEQLHKRQQHLREQTDSLARQLQQLRATVAAQHAQAAAERLKQDAADQQRRPSSSHQVAQAERDLDEAARQLAQRIKQAEDDLVLEIIRRFQTELNQMVDRQQRVLNDTIELDRRRNAGEALVPDAEKAILQLAAQERQLAQLAREHGELLSGLSVVRVSLQRAEEQLLAAAERLDKADTGFPTQQAEQHALTRLQLMREAFQQTVAEAGHNPPARPSASDNAQQAQRPPTFDLLQLKMLRMLQAELKDRTNQYQQRLANNTEPTDDSQKAELEREARDLATEQGRLAELVQDILTRHNQQ